VRGTDVTQAQFDAAEQFWRTVPAKVDPARDPVVVSRSDLIRLLAWYGALRAEGARKGAGSAPGVIVPRQPRS
jgi:hypothetical protein